MMEDVHKYYESPLPNNRNYHQNELKLLFESLPSLL